MKELRKLIWAVDILAEAEPRTQVLKLLKALSANGPVSVEPVYLLSPVQTRISPDPVPDRDEALRALAEKRLADTNLKTVIAEAFAAPTLQSEGLSYVREIPADDAAVMGVQPATPGMEVHILSRSFGRTPITFQIMRVPPTRYALRLDFNPPGHA